MCGALGVLENVNLEMGFCLYGRLRVFNDRENAIAPDEYGIALVDASEKSSAVVRLCRCFTDLDDIDDELAFGHVDFSTTDLKRCIVYAAGQVNPLLLCDDQCSIAVIRKSSLSMVRDVARSN